MGGFRRNLLGYVYIEHEQRGLEARRDQQVLEVLVAAVVEEVDHFLVRPDLRQTRPSPVALSLSTGTPSPLRRHAVDATRDNESKAKDADH